MRKIRINAQILQVVIIVVFMIVTFIPICSTNQYSIIMGLIIVSGLMFYPSILLKNKALWELVLFIIVLLIYFLFGKGLSFNLFGLLYWALCFLSAIITFLSMDFLEEKQIRFLISLLICLVIYSNISTIIASVVNPMAVRMYGYSSRSGAQEFYSTIKSKYGLIYMYSYGVGEALAVISPYLLAYSLNAKKQILAIFGIAAVILSIISQAMAALTASLFLTILFCSLVLLSYIRVSQTQGRFRIALIIVLILLIGGLYFSQVVENNFLLQQKFGDIFSVFKNGNTSGDISERGSLILRSIKEWLYNPVFGWADVGGLYTNNGVSMHSALFDYLGLYGIFTFLLIGTWWKCIKKGFNMLSKKELKYFKWGAISLAFLLITKGPVTIGTNFYFSVVLAGLLINDKSRHYDVHGKLMKRKGKM